jgi:transcription elongation factor GreB
MSKAFTRESDDEPEAPLPARPATLLPPGTPNYLTEDGAVRLRAELDRLINEEQPALQRSGGEKPGTELRRVDQRIREISEILGSAQVVPAPPAPWHQVGFGAIVTVRKPDGEEITYRLVGVDEVDLDRAWVSWLTPVARALMNARLGDHVPVQLPRGRTEFEVLKIEYPQTE